MRLLSIFLVILVLLSVIASIIFLFAYRVLPEFLITEESGRSNRIALAQFSIEVASLGALLLAAWEFHQSQRRPKLSLWIERFHKDHSIGIVTRKTDVTSEYRSKPGVGTLYNFPFTLLLENTGNAAARWIKVTLQIDDPRSPVDIGPNESELTIAHKDFKAGSWISDTKAGTIKRYTFRSSESFVAYERPSRVEDSRHWMDEIGFFQLRVPVGKDEQREKITVKINCSIQADGFPRLDQVLEFNLKEVVT